MKKYKIRYSELFEDDIRNITAHIYQISRSKTIARGAYSRILAAINKRSYCAECFEAFVPYPDAPSYYRIYVGKYTVYYLIAGEYMVVQRALCSASEVRGRLSNGL